LYLKVYLCSIKRNIKMKRLLIVISGMDFILPLKLFSVSHSAKCCVKVLKVNKYAFFGAYK
jgi:hypothetical protein